MTNKEKYVEQIIENFFDGLYSTGIDRETGKQPRKIFENNIMSEGIYLWNRNKQMFEKIKNETDIFNKIKAMNKGDSFIVTRADNGYIIL